MDTCLPAGVSHSMSLGAMSRHLPPEISSGRNHRIPALKTLSISGWLLFRDGFR